jgi:hypothetical protein
MAKRKNTARIAFTVISILLLLSLILGFVVMLIPGQ